MVNPEDAAREGWQEGSLVRISRKGGSVEAPVEITDALMAGVVRMKDTFWFNLNGCQALFGYTSNDESFRTSLAVWVSTCSVVTAELGIFELFW